MATIKSRDMVNLEQNVISGVMTDVKDSAWISVGALKEALLAGDASPEELEGRFEAVGEDLLQAVRDGDYERLQKGFRVLRRVYEIFSARLTDQRPESIALGRLIEIVELLSKITRIMDSSDFVRLLNDHKFLPVLTMLKDHEASSTEIEKALGIEKTILSKRIHALEDAGLVVTQRTGRNLYSRLSVRARRGLERIDAEPHKSDAQDSQNDLDGFLDTMVRNNASHLHLRAGHQPIIRKHGELEHVGQVKLTDEYCFKIISEIMTDFQKKQLQERKEIDFGYTSSRGDFQVSVFTHKESVSAVIRLIPTHFDSLDALGLESDIDKLFKSKKRLLMITSPTGSEKPGLVESVVEHINTHKAFHVLLIEEWPRFFHKNNKSIFTNIAVGEDVPDFSSAINMALRLDPDVIVADGIRDHKSLKLLARAAELKFPEVFVIINQGGTDEMREMIDSYPANERKEFRDLLRRTMYRTYIQKSMPGYHEVKSKQSMQVQDATRAVLDLLDAREPGSKIPKIEASQLRPKERALSAR